MIKCRKMSICLHVVQCDSFVYLPKAFFLLSRQTFCLEIPFRRLSEKQLKTFVTLQSANMLMSESSLCLQRGYLPDISYPVHKT